MALKNNLYSEYINPYTGNEAGYGHNLFGMKLALSNLQEKLPEIKKKMQGSKNEVDYLEFERLVNDFLVSTNTHNAEVENASKVFNSTLLNVAKNTDGYDELSESQKMIISRFIDGFSIDSSTGKGDLADMRSDVINLVNNIHNMDGLNETQKATLKGAIDDVFNIDVSNLSVADAETALESAFNEIVKYLPELSDKFKDDNRVKDFKKSIWKRLGFGFDVNGNSTIDEMSNAIQNKFSDLFGGKDVGELLTLDQMQILYGNIEEISQININSIEDLILAIKRYKNTTNGVKPVRNVFTADDGAGNKTTFGELTDQLNKIQDAYSTLYKATDEYNQKGMLSVDTYESIIGLGSQYLQYLFDENGKLKLNKQALKELALARIKEQEIRAKSALIDNLNSIQSETDAVNYLKNSLELANSEMVDLNEATLTNWAMNAKAKGISQETATNILNSIIGDFNNITRLSQLTANGLDQSVDAAMGTISSAKELQEQLKQVNDKEALNKLQYAIDETTISVNELDRALEVLDAVLTLTSEKDYATKMGYVSSQIDLTREKASLLKNEFNNLVNINPQSANEAETLASRLETIGNNLRDNYKAAVEYNLELEKLNFKSLMVVDDDYINRVDKFGEQVSKNVKRMQGEGLGSISISLLPDIPKSAYEKQKEENENLISDQQATSDKITEIKRKALELQKQENDKAIAKEKAQLQAALDDNTQNIVNANDSIVTDVEETSTKIIDTIYNTGEKVKGVVDSTVGYTKQAINGLKNGFDWVTVAKEDNYKELGELMDEYKISDNNPIEKENFRRIASQYYNAPYKYGGTDTAGIDCSGLTMNIYRDAGVNIPRTAAEQYKDKSATAVSAEDAKLGDLVFFKGSYGSETNPGHVAIYLGNGKILEAPGTGKNVQITSLSNKGKVLGYRRVDKFQDYLGEFNSSLLFNYAKGTPSGNNAQGKFGIAGENYKPEILLDKETGQAKYIDEPTVINTSKTDVIGEKKTKSIKRYASGTPMTNSDWLGYLKEACDALNIPYEIALSLIDQETSNGADSETWRVNSAGAYGLTQITPSALGDLTDGSSVGNKYSNILKANGIDIKKSRTGGVSNARENIWTGLATLAAIKDRYFKGNDDTFKKSLGWYYAGGNWNGKDGQWYANEVISRSQTQPFVNAANSLGGAIADGIQQGAANVLETEKDNMDKHIAQYRTRNKDLTKIYYDNQKQLLQNRLDETGEKYVSLIRNNNLNENTRKSASNDNDYNILSNMSIAMSERWDEYLDLKEDLRLAKEYYNKRVAEGATVDQLSSLIEEMSKIEENLFSAEDSYVSSIKEVSDYFSSSITRSANDFSNTIENIEKRRGYITDEMENARTSEDMHKLYHADFQLLNDIINTSDEAMSNYQNLFYNTFSSLAGENYRLKKVLDDVSLEQFYDEFGNIREEYLNEFLAPYRASNNDEYNDFATNVYQLVTGIGKTYYEAYIDSYDKKYDAEKQRTEAIRKELDYGLEILEKRYSEAEKDISKKNEIIDDKNTRLNGLLDITSEFYSAVNKLTDVQHNADKAIADSRILKQYLNADEYQRIYNEEDYQKITEKVEDINDDISALTRRFKRQVEEAYASGNLYLVETITSEYKRQLELKQKEVELTQGELTLRQKEQQLKNVVDDRSIRQMVERDGKFIWEWVADNDKVRQATEELANAQYELEKQKTERTQTIDLNKYNAEIDNNSKIKAANEEWLKTFRESLDVVKENVDKVNNPIEDMATALNVFQEYGVNGLNQAVNDMLDVFGDFMGKSYGYNKLFNGDIVSVGEDGKAVKNLSVGTLVKTSDGNYLITGINADESYQSIKTKDTIKKEPLNIYMVSEDVSDNKIHYLTDDELDKLGYASMPQRYMNPLLLGNGPIDTNSSSYALSAFKPIENTQNVSTKNNINNLYGDIVVNEPSDYNAFTTELINGFKRNKK